MDVKQVIVIRTDLNMRKGKMAAQASHASCSILIDKINALRDRPSEAEFTAAEMHWINEKFTKICVGVPSLEELLEVHEMAIKSGLVSKLITDSGATEFKGVPTVTCLAIGPDLSCLINNVTGHLNLL